MSEIISKPPKLSLKTVLWLVACVACFLAGWILPSPRTQVHPVTMSMLEPSSKELMESGCPWPTDWEHVTAQGYEFAVGIENRTMWAPSRHSIFVYAREPESNDWFAEFIMADIVGGGPIRMQMNKESGIMKFMQITGANTPQRNIGTYDTNTAAPLSGR